MLTDTLFRVPRRDGLQLLQRRDGSLARELTSWRLHLSPGASQTYRAPDEETIVVLQEGAGRFTVGKSTWDVRRANVFAERATALYLPPGRALTVFAESPPPGYRLYYLWAMAGRERRLALHEDPEHKWIHDAH